MTEALKRYVLIFTGGCALMFGALLVLALVLWPPIAFAIYSFKWGGFGVLVSLGFILIWSGGFAAVMAELESSGALKKFAERIEAGLE